DGGQKCYTLHWFDSYGTPPGKPGRGQWEGETLMFEHESPKHRGRTSFRVAEDELRFKVEMDADGKGWKPAVEGHYHRRLGPPRRLARNRPPRGLASSARRGRHAGGRRGGASFGGCASCGGASGPQPSSRPGGAPPRPGGRRPGAPAGGAPAATRFDGVRAAG